MKRRAALLVVTAALLFAAPAARADFSRIANGLRSLGFERTSIPFISLARAMVRVVQPSGVHDFQIAVYENTPAVSELEIERVVTAQVGKGYSRLVRVRSNRSGESVFIFARPGRDARVIELLILAREREETVLVRLVADAEIVGREMIQPAAMHKMASR